MLMSPTNEPNTGEGHPPMDLLMDIPLRVTVELGRRQMPIADILALGPGSVVELSKAAGEPLDIYVNDRLVARGEAVLVGDRYGVRLTAVFTPGERKTAAPAEGVQP
jgi:flagellar motor switch protein FliN/FliY